MTNENEKDTTFRRVQRGPTLQGFMEKLAEPLKPFLSTGATLEINMTLYYSEGCTLCVEMEHALPTITLKTTKH